VAQHLREAVADAGVAADGRHREPRADQLQGVDDGLRRTRACPLFRSCFLGDVVEMEAPKRGPCLACASTLGHNVQSTPSQQMGLSILVCANIWMLKCLSVGAVATRDCLSSHHQVAIMMLCMGLLTWAEAPARAPASIRSPGVMSCGSSASSACSHMTSIMRMMKQLEFIRRCLAECRVPWGGGRGCQPNI
jgi:hypothetical protein